ncbi:MAG: nucleoside 2-deoxyribosyltransferase [Candidatus Saccharibacteria bacterium]|nr:nucleoside 2-deoxyribosyltransferase [Candidatus Saccharibacteria bacterium]
MSNLKVYFACSIRGGGDTSSYLTILEVIKSAGAEVLSEIFVHDAINFGGSPLPAEEIYARDIGMINNADIVIAEVTNPSLGVGYELAYAEKLERPILCLFMKDSEKKLSAMVTGNAYNHVAYVTPETLKETIEQFLAQATLPRTLQRKTDR